MDFPARIAAAQKHVDQTRGNFNAAKRDTSQSQAAYDKSHRNVPSFQTDYQKQKLQFEKEFDVAGKKSTYDKSKDAVDSIRKSIDKLPDSINQQFGGTSLTQAQRDMAKEKQLGELSGKFNQYDADYQVSFSDYSQSVDQAFSQSMDVANKNYDQYWDTVKIKFDTWQKRIKDEKDWGKRFSSSQDKLSKVNTQYDSWKFEQQMMQQEREFQQWINNFEATNRQINLNHQKSMARIPGDVDRFAANRKKNNDQLYDQFGKGQISWEQVQKRTIRW